MDIVDQQGMKLPMKKGPTIFLQVVIVLIGMGALGLMLWEPHIEGRNAHATLFEIYFKDPFLAYAIRPDENSLAEIEKEARCVF